MGWMGIRCSLLAVVLGGFCVGKGEMGKEEVGKEEVGWAVKLRFEEDRGGCLKKETCVILNKFQINTKCCP
jgi:hypothetical protein